MPHVCVCVHVFAVVHRFALPSGPNICNARGFYGRIICMFLINRYISQGSFSAIRSLTMLLYPFLIGFLVGFMQHCCNATRLLICPDVRTVSANAWPLFVAALFSRCYSNIIFRRFAKCLHALRNLSVRAEVKRVLPEHQN